MQKRASFSHLGFVVAAAGSAIGLGNIWKFPYITYAHQGGSFVLVYLAAVALIGAPIMMAEILIGRRTGTSPVSAFLELARGVAGGRLWAAVGYLGVFTGFIILSYYSVVAGWTVYYFGKCVGWSIGGFPPEVANDLQGQFVSFVSSGWLPLVFHTFFMLLTIGVILMGVKGGIERVTKILLPVLFAILALLCVVSIWSPGFHEAISFLFHFSPIDRQAVLEAVGHSFFTLSLGMGAMITYGSYVARDHSIRRDAALVCVLDTLIALMACVVMFSIIFTVPEAQRTDTFSKSAAILFTTIPKMLYQLPLGTILAPLFYLLVAFAALTSTISLLEVVVSYFIDHRGWSRRRATWITGTVITALGGFAAYSLGASPTLAHWAPVGHGPGDSRVGLFNVMDYLASNWMLPVGGFFISAFTGWFLSNRLTRDELEAGGGPFRYHWLWKLLLRIVCPLAIAWIIASVIQGVAFN